MTQADAIAIRRARHARVRTIRRRVVSATVALFVATWLLITLILVTGHDPALAHQSSGHSAASTTGSSSGSVGSGGASASSGATAATSPGATSSSTGGTSAPAPSSVTSRQS